MSAKHTPGPWAIDFGYNRIIKSIGPCVPDQYAGSAWLRVSEEDARLIAAAPVLLAFAKEWLERQGTDENYMTAKARAAIAKVIG